MLEGLSPEEWLRLERLQFRELMERVIPAAAGVDAELEERVTALERARTSGHELGISLFMSRGAKAATVPPATISAVGGSWTPLTSMRRSARVRS